jgi:EAL domain-containing protein (putative c-di-GMP-specific phosphodiesterase class I)
MSTKFLQDHPQLFHSIQTNDVSQLELYFQPIYSIQSQETIGFEILLRDNANSENHHSPAKVLEKFDKQDEIHIIDLIIIEKALQQLQNWGKEGVNVDFVSINVNAKTLSSKSAIAVFENLLSEYDGYNYKIVLEITETNPLKNLSHIQNTMDLLRSYGIRFAVDDFGTGYSQLQYLHQLKWNIIKIDKWYTQHYVSSQQIRSVTKFIVNLAHELGFKVVLEGVEDTDQLHIAQVLSVDFIQGYYCGYPQPASYYMNKLTKSYKDTQTVV